MDARLTICFKSRQIQVSGALEGEQKFFFKVQALADDNVCEVRIGASQK